MKWKINQLQKYRSKEFRFDEYVNADEIMEIDKSIRAVSPIRVTGWADIRTLEFSFHMSIKGHLILPCSRTLVDVNYPIDVDTIETFLLNDSDSIYDSEDEVHQVKGDVIDLTPIINEILLLEVPMQVIAKDRTEEGAPQSGTGWEVIHDQEKKDKVDPRLAGLAKFFDQNNQSSDS